MDYLLNKKAFISEFSNSLESSDLSIFIGAGMSFEAGLPSWKNLLANLANQINININQSQDYYQIAQYCENKLGKSDTRNRIVSSLRVKNFKSKILQSILELPANSFWTTNFDKILERNMEQVFGCEPDIVYRDMDLTKAREKAAKIVFKLNGHIEDQRSLILTKKDLEGYNFDHPALLSFLKRELIVNTFIFLGYSFTDTLVLSALRDVNRCLGFSNPTHYHYTILKEQNNQEFHHFVSNLETSYGIKSLIIPKNLFPNCSDNALDQKMDEARIAVVNEINRHIQMKQIFISGSFRNLSSEERSFANKISKYLTSKILESGYRISNGVGKGVGSRIIGYASEWLVENNQKVEKKLILRSRSFHNYKYSNSETFNYRKYTMRDSGIALFMFGQGDLDKNGSQGVRQEFEVAKELGLKIIPLGVTGYEALNIWNEVKNNTAEYGYLEKYMESLRTEKNADKLVKIIITIINDLQ